MANPLEISLSKDFIFPTNKDIGAKLRSDADNKITYLCGNSLGLCSNRSKQLINEEIDVWSTRAVTGHFSHPHSRPWTSYGNNDQLVRLMAEVVGAKSEEVAVMSTLTANLHLMMTSFYKPTSERYKILYEARAFPSDQYAFYSQVVAHGLDPAKAVIEVSPREGEFTLREDDIEGILEREGSSIALVLFSGIQYYTGQWFDIPRLTAKAKAQGCICGWDLAHAVGNVPLSLHDWDADFAVWCTYKYLNSSPGGIAGLYMHEKWNSTQHPRFAGWWGHELSTRFEMPPKFQPIVGAQGFQQSNPCIIALASLLGSLQLFKEAGMMPVIRERSVQLTARLQELLVSSKFYIAVDKVKEQYPEGVKDKAPTFTILTPLDPDRRGAQLSLLFLPIGTGLMQKIFARLSDHGIIGDEREPDVIRLAPCPLYNTVLDCEKAAESVEEAFNSLT